MSAGRGHDPELEIPHDVEGLATMLRDQRPLPAVTFRGDLRRHLLAHRDKRPRPARLRAMITAYASSGAALLVTAALISTT